MYFIKFVYKINKLRFLIYIINIHIIYIAIYDLRFINLRLVKKTYIVIFTIIFILNFFNCKKLIEIVILLKLQIFLFLTPLITNIQPNLILQEGKVTMKM